MILELAGLRSFNRPVPRIVYPWSHLVRQKLAVTFEKLDRQYADVIQLLQDLPCRPLTRFLQYCGQIRRRGERQPQNPATVMILYQRIERGLAALASHRQNG